MAFQYSEWKDIKDFTYDDWNNYFDKNYYKKLTLIEDLKNANWTPLVWDWNIISNKINIIEETQLLSKL